MERFHSISVTCDNCQGEKTKITEAGLSINFHLAINYKCAECGAVGTKIDDVCLLVAKCREQEGVALS